jgi:glutathione reductase (NADPH)
MKEYDLIVIGAGSGGVRAARIASNYGAKVLVAEGLNYGGTCVNRGCVPKKLFTYAAQFNSDFDTAKSYGWEVPEQIPFNWQTLIKNKDQEIERLNDIYKSILEKNKVDRIDGYASFKDSEIILINNEEFKGKKILIASGGVCNKPVYTAKEKVLTSDDIFHIKELPKDICILGGGYIAVEFACIMNGLGVKTTLIYRGERILKSFDQDLTNLLQDEMIKKGIDIKFNANIEDIIEAKEGLEIKMQQGPSIKAACVLSALGRSPNVDQLNLDKTGIQQKKNGAIIVDEFSQTNIDHIYAIGDVTDRINLTPVAIREGHAFADTEFGNNKRSASHKNIPSTVFTDPPLSTVGITSEEALKLGIKIKTFKTQFSPMKYTFVAKKPKILMKLLVDEKTDKVLGIHMLGQDSPEIIQSLAVTLTAGATKKDFDNTTAIHPTSSEEFVTLK